MTNKSFSRDFSASSVTNRQPSHVAWGGGTRSEVWRHSSLPPCLKLVSSTTFNSQNDSDSMNGRHCYMYDNVMIPSFISAIRH